MRCLIAEHHADILPAINTGVLRRLRREECARLDWNEVRLDRGLHRGDVEEFWRFTAQRRLVTIRPNLASLAPLRSGVSPVFPTCYNVCATALRRLVVKVNKYDKNALLAFVRLVPTSPRRCEDSRCNGLWGRDAFLSITELVTPEDASHTAIMPGDTTGGNIVTLAKPAAAPWTNAAAQRSQRLPDASLCALQRAAKICVLLPIQHPGLRNHPHFCFGISVVLCAK